MLKIFSYNVNGLRSVISKGFLTWLEKENPDMICLQEVKIQEGQIDVKKLEDLGYNHYWHYAEKKGYSGVALLSKIKPLQVSYGIGIPEFDMEGRTVIAYFEKFVIISVYFPSGSSGDVRQAVKMKFLDIFLNFIKEFLKKHPNIIVSGDYNICHKPIDINFPQKHTKMSGFLPEERAWMDTYVDAGMVDSFRVFNQQPDQYTWWSSRFPSAKLKNLGWRIDYHFVSEALKGNLLNASIKPEVTFSDHCPIAVELEI
jgi:exodeoxyribonuclease-3